MRIAKKIDFNDFFSSILAGQKELRSFYKIAQQWDEFAGQTFKKITYPLKVLTNRSGDSILFVVVPNSSVGSQFYYSKEQIIYKICLYFGYNVITDIKIIQ